ncbi:GTP pyrophosphokinase [Porphyromonas crevioricanis]|uniref:GTP pyrophosphokinase n=2 Tax=Porphyromonas crevioricanis TaxID=393921 RepID=A0A2X4PN78_9PORP|nr:GTP pyrophosphokinase [Porphyromonas crevioricanis JCM 13913]SQH73283.1 GTP pyrophosphokinase [Porphyromonas crevioricanis]
MATEIDKNNHNENELSDPILDSSAQTSQTGGDVWVLTPATSEMTDEEIVERAYGELIKTYLQSNHRQKVDKIEKAFRLANEAHKGAKRRSGEPYILHPIAVAQIVSQEIGLGSTSICCALLHDVVEDTEYTVEDIRDMFGDKVSQIVDGLTKISGEVFSNSSLQAENFRKLILTMNDDIRVILIKMADRLHNMRILASMHPAKQLKIAAETMYVYAPLAHRLGLFAIKSELEDLSFQYEHPEEFESIKAKIKNTDEHRQEIFDHFAAPVFSALDSLGIKYEIKARVKSIFSIWKKMQKKGVSFEEIYDLFAVRIIFESSPEQSDKNRCWEIYSAITDIYKSRPERLRDWVSEPKSNGYQALHLTVMGPDGEWVEVQIRSRRMDEIAEKGFAAHWKYKGDNVEEDSELDKWLRTIQEILVNPNPNAMDFLDTIKLNLFSGEIMVFTPKGEIVKLPQGATALDFAYAIHTNIGHQCIGAKANHRLVPMSYKLSSGDQVEILTSKTQEPTEEWIAFVTTAKAKSKVDAFLRKKHRDIAALGQEKVETLIGNNQVSSNITNLDKLAEYFGFSTREEFFYAVGSGSVTLPDSLKKLPAISADGKSGNIFMRFFRSALGGGNKSSQPIASQPLEVHEHKFNPKEIYVLSDSLAKPNYEIAPCCKPIPGDDAFGFISDDNKVIVHKRSCPVAMRLKSSYGDRILSTRWSEHVKSTFEATLSIKGIDSNGILNAIAQAFKKELTINVREIHLTAKDGIFSGKIKLLVHSVMDVHRVCQTLGKDTAIKNIGRIIE